MKGYDLKGEKDTAKEQRIPPRHGTFGEKIPPRHSIFGQKIPPQELFGERYQGETTKRMCHGLMTHPHALFNLDYYSYTASAV